MDRITFMARTLQIRGVRVKNSIRWPTGHGPSSRRGEAGMIASMKTLTILLAVALAAVVIVLVLGVVAMARGGEFNRKYGNKLMRARVALQGLAIVLFLLFVFAAGSGG
jgi:hypothetical protein